MAARRSPTAAAPPDGLRYAPDFITAEEERALIAGIEVLPFGEVKMHGVTARRTVVHFGWDYGYESWTIERSQPLPVFLHPLRARCAELLALDAEALEQVLVARYPPGAGIGWHRDAPMFGPEVVGVSLLAACTLRLRRKTGDGFEVWPLVLEPRSVYVLAGAARREWQHMIPAARSLRYSITFRTVRRGCKK